MSTSISEFRDPVRAVLGDFNTTVRRYQDSAIDAVVKTLVRCGKFTGLAIDATGLAITPNVQDGAQYGRIVYEAALAFVAPNAGAYSYRTRALAETFGEQKLFLQQLQNALYDLETGGGAAMFGTVQTFRGWVLSLTGLNAWEEMSEVKLQTPVSTITVGADGVQVST